MCYHRALGNVDRCLGKLSARSFLLQNERN